MSMKVGYVFSANQNSPICMKTTDIKLYCQTTYLSRTWNYLLTCRNPKKCGKFWPIVNIFTPTTVKAVSIMDTLTIRTNIS